MLRLRSVFNLPVAYRLFQKAVAGRHHETYVREYVKPLPGQRVLDIGCGPGDVLDYFPPVQYVGFDNNPKYIRAAQARFGTRGTFRCESVSDCRLESAVGEPGSCDIVMAHGVMHHLNDPEVRALLALARRALKPEGRLVTLDGGYVPGQSLVARALLALDRGKFVRRAEAYRALASEVFGEVCMDVRHDMIRVPYTHVILVCSGFAGPDQVLPRAA
jgi:SAM-dependent methyltransferase